MLKEKILSVHAVLGEVLGNVRDEDNADLLRACRRNLDAAAEQAGALENALAVEDWSRSAGEGEAV